MAIRLYVPCPEDVAHKRLRYHLRIRSIYKSKHPLSKSKMHLMEVYTLFPRTIRPIKTSLDAKIL